MILKRIQVENASVIFSRFIRSKKGKNSLKESILANFHSFFNTQQKQEKESFYALRNLSVDVKEGEILGVIGPNGAGKTTLLRLLGGIYPPNSGSVKINGSISALLSLGTGFENELNGIDNIYINGLFLGIPKTTLDKRIDKIIEFSELSEFIYQPVKTYSTGMRARLGFSIALFVNCDIMLVDEILGVGDKSFRKKSKEAILNVIESKRTVVLVSHNIKDIEALSDRCLWLDHGEAKMFGISKDVTKKFLEEKS